METKVPKSNDHVEIKIPEGDEPLGTSMLLRVPSFRNHKFLTSPGEQGSQDYEP
jgi:hypothetical protein